ncbi:MobQ family relaxase, partial [Tepidimonas sediminis]|uniref:MobQ family relaxase n=1 Tax=Tepidimonas sediminis TaxID=2588941 RepID=UPI00163D61AA
MAIYHFSVKTVSRSTGRSAVAAAAYRSASKLVCPRTGLTHDYRRRQRGVLAQRLFLPRDLTMSRQQIWSAAELAETRKNSTVAREIEVALPHELTLQQQQALLSQFARELIEKHGVAVDIAIHAPSKNGDEKNVHAHILMTTRRILETGQLGEKTREWDDRKSGTVEFWRERWSQIVNEALEKAGHDARIDHRSLKEQGIDRIPGRHHGVSATAIERKKRGASRRIDDLQKEQKEAKKRKSRAR